MRKDKKKRKILFIIIGLLFLFVIGKVLLSASSLLPFAFQLLFDRDIKLKEDDNRVNILLLGIGGGNHDGPNLTDTIIFMSLDPQKGKVSLVSIPRDLWVEDLKGRINVAYAKGEARKKGGGITLSQAVVTKITNQPIDYTVRIDFDGFIKAVDLVGGLDVNVERVLDDKEYPIEGNENDTCGKTDEEVEVLATASSQLEAFPCRYMTLHFDKGMQHMDGKTALMFVRSRHASGEEGTDFARSKRQEKILTALKDKILSPQTLINPAKIISLYDVIKGSIDTNIKTDEYDDFIRLAQKLRDSRIQSIVIDYGDEIKDRPGLLINPPISKDYNFEWVLIPRIGNENFKEIHDYINCYITNGVCTVSRLPLD